MNKVYRVIWNASLGAWVAVSEITKSKGKKSNKAIKSGVLVYSLVLFAGNAIAAPVTAGGGSATGSDAIAVGQNANASGLYSIALGVNSVAQKKHAVALGEGTQVLGDDGVAVGTRAKALANYSTALGNQSTAKEEFDLAVGYNTIASGGQSTAVGYGSQSTGYASNAIGNSSLAEGRFSTAVGQESKAAANFTLAAGYKAKALGEQSTAVGYGSNSTGYGSNAIGSSSLAKGLHSTAIGSSSLAEGDYSIALGQEAKTGAGKNFATALGYKSNASGWSSFAQGAYAEASGGGSIAIGDSSKATTNDTIAIGVKSEANLDNSVALGIQSKTSTNAVTVTSATVGGITYGGFAGTVSSVGHQISVGDTGKERQIKHVAAGTISDKSTDAINGSQLFSTQKALGNLANSTKNILGGDAALNPDGTLTMTNIGNTGKNTIHDAIKAATTKVDGTQGVSVSSKPNQDGSTTYTVAAKTDGTTLNVDPQSGNLMAVTSALTNNSNGSVSTPAAPNALATAGNVANAINNAGFNLQANGDTKSLVKTGDTVQFLNGDNIKITRAGNDITVATAKNVTFDSVQIGANGPTIKADASNNIKIAKSDGSATKITNVAAGTADTDAVNLSQLNQVAANQKTSSVKAGTNIASVDATTSGNNTEYTVNAKGTTVTQGDGIDLTTTDAGSNTTNYKVGLNQATKDSLAKADSALQTISSSNPNVVVSAKDASGNQTVGFLNNPTFAGTVTAPTFVTSGANPVTMGNGTVSGLTNTTFDPKATYTGGQAATQEQLSSASSQLNNTLTAKGMGYMGDSGTVVHRDLGTQVNVKGGATGTLTSGNIGVVADGTDTLNVQLAKDINLGTDGSLTTGNTKVNNTGVTISNGTKGQPVSLTASGLNNGGNTITNVAAGTADTDAVNVNQLKAAKSTVEGNKGVSVTSKTNNDGSTTYTVAAKTDGTTTKIDNNGKIAAVTAPLTTNTDGKVNTPAAPNALATAGNVANAINNAGFNLQANGDTKSLVKTGDTVQFLNGDNIKITRAGNDITVATAKNVTFDSVQIGANGPTIKADASNNIKIAKSDGSATKITNVAAGTADTDAVNLSQLNQVAANQKTSSVKAGTNIASVDATTSGNNTEYTVNAKGTTVTQGDGIDLTTTDAGSNTTNYKVGLNQATKDSLAKADSALQTISSSNPNVVVSAKDASGNQTVGFLNNPTFAGTVTAPTFVTSGANPVTMGNGTVSGLTNTTFDPKATYTGGQAATQEQLSSASSQLNNTLTAKGMGYMGDSGTVVHRDLGTQVNVKGGATGTLTSGNIGVVADGTDTLNVQLAKDINLGTDGSLTTGNTKVNNTGVTISNGTKGQPVSLTASGLNNGGNTITNVAAGTADTDAVNVNQLKAAKSTVEGNKGVSVTSKTNNDGSTTYTVAAKTDGTTTKIDNNGKIAAVTAPLTTNTDGKVNTPAAPNALATAGNVANAINNAGFNLQANGDTKSLVKTGDTVQFLNGDNIKITRAGNDITVATAKNVTFDSVQIGANGPTIKADASNNIKIAKSDGSATKITNVAAGTADTDAVNLSQLNQVAANQKTSSVKAGTNIASVDATTSGNNTEYTVNAKGTTVTQGDGIDLTTTDAGSNTTNYKVGLNQATKDSLAKADSALQTISSSNPNVVVSAKDASGNQTVGFLNNPTFAGTVTAPTFVTSGANPVTMGNGTVSGLTNTTFDPKATYTGGQAATQEQLSSASSQLNNTLTAKGMGYMGDSGTVVHRDLGTQVNVKGGATGTLTSGNIGVVADGTDTLNVQLAKDINLGTDGSLTTGNTKVNNTGVTISNGTKGQPVSLTASGLNNGGNTITNVAAGTADTDAVNVNQLKAAKSTVEGNKGVSVTSKTNNDGSTTYTVAAKTDGTTTKIDNNGKIAAVTAPLTTNTDGKVNTPAAPNALATASDIANAINSSGFTLKTSATANGKKLAGGDELINPGDSVEMIAGKNMQVTQEINGKVTYATKDEVEFNKVTVGPVSINNVTGIDAGNTAITNVADGGVSTTSKDAINGSQLYNTSSSVANALGGGSVVNPDGTVKAPSYTVNNAAVSNVGDAIKALDKGWTVNADGKLGAGKAVKAGDSVDIGVANNEKNITVAAKTANGKTVIDFALAKDLKVDSVNAGGTVINNNGLSFVNDTGALIANTPSITKTGIDAGSNKITNVAAGDVSTTSKDAINGSQLNTVKETAEKGWNFTATNGSATSAADTVKPGETLDFANTDGNIGIASGDNKLTFNLAKNIKVDSVTAGDTVVKNDGITIVGGPSVTKTGIDAGSNKITNVADGGVSTTSKDAINGSQLYNTSSSVANALGGGSVVNPDGTVKAPSYTVNNAAVNNVGDAIKALDKGWTVNSNGKLGTGTAVKAGDQVDIGVATGEQNLTTIAKTDNGTTTIGFKLNPDLKVSSVNAGGTVINNNGLSFVDANGGPLAKAPSIKKDGIDAGGNKITNVAAGTGDNDAVNVSQLKAVEATANQGWNLTTNGKTASKSNVKPGDTVDFANEDGNVKIENKGNNVIVNLNKDIGLTKDGSVTIGDTKLNNNNLTVGGTHKVTVDGETGTIKGLTNTTWNPNATYTGGQAATQEQLKSAGNQLTTKGLNFNGNQGGNIHKNLGQTLAVKGALANDAAASAKNLRVDSENGELIVKISENPVFTTVQTGEAGDRLIVNKDGLTITNVGKATVSLTEKGLDNGNNQIVNVASGLTKNGNKVELKDAKGNTLTNAVNVGDLKEAANNLVTTGFKIDADKRGNGLTDADTVELGQTVKYTGKDGNIVTTVTDNAIDFALNSTLSVGKAGEPGKVGIKGADGKDAISLNGEDGTIGINGKDGSNATLTVEKGKPGLDGKDGQTRIVYTKPNGSKEEVATLNDGLNFKADDGSIVAKKLNETLEIVGGADKDSLTDNNIGVNNKNGKLTVQLAKDININSVKFGANGPTIKADANNNINIAKSDGSATKITNVEAGTGDKDAVNVSQLEKAQAAATTKVEEADGIKVVPTKNADGSTTYTVSAKTDGTTTTINADGKIAAVTTTFKPSTDGKVGAPVGNGDSLVTANTVADAINNSGWKATSGATGSGVVNGTTEELINPSETVTFRAGDNMVLNQAENVFTYSLNKDININSVQFNNGPKITNDGNNIKIGDKDGNATKITNVAAGTGDNDAVNVSQLKEAANNLVTTGFNIADGKGGKDNVKLGETVTFTDPAGNIITTVTDNKVEFGLNSTLSVGKDGEPGKVGIKGADGKDAISLNGEDGTIGINGKNGANATLTVEKAKPALDGKDGQNGENGQTRIVYTKPNGSKEEVATLNDGLNFKADDGSIVAKKLNETLEIVGGADKDKLTDNNIGVNNKNGKLTVQLAKDININSVKFGDNGPTIKADASNNINIAKSDGSATKITNVKAGTGDKDAVNVSQLKAAQAAATTKVEGDKGVSVTPKTNNDGSTTYTVAAKTDGTTTTINADGKIAAVTTTFKPSTDGKVGAPVGNGDSLVTANTVADAINNSGWKATSGATGSGVVNGTTEELINPSETVTFRAGDNMVLNQAENVFTYSLNKDININSVQFNNGPKITNDGNNIKVGDKDGNATKITNVAAGTGDNDAVNVSQLKAVEATANKGWNLTTNGKPESKSNVKPGDTVDFANEDGNVKIENKGNNVIVNLNKDIDLTKDGSVTIGDTKVNNDGLTIAGGPSVTKSGIDAGDKKITNVAPGKISADSKDAINGSQLYTVQQAAVAAKTEVKAGDNVEVKKESGGNGQDIYTVSAKDTSASVTAGSTAVAVTKGATTKVGTTDVTDYKVDLSQSAKDDIKKGVDAKDIVDNKGLTFAGDSGSTSVQKLGSTVNVKGDKNITTKASGNTVEVALNPNVTVDSVTATQAVNVGSGGAQVALTTNVGKDGVRELSVGSANAPTRITNVARGVNDTDAVNLSQLKDLGYNINTKIDKVEKEANAGIASAMAMETAPFIAGKWTYAVGAAYYGGEQAVGATLRKTADNGRWSLTGGVATGTEGDPSVRIGISGVID